MPQLTEKEIREKVDPLCDAFEAAWLLGQRPLLTDLVHDAAPEIRSKLFTELLCIELEFRTQDNQVPGQAEYESRYPDFAAEIQAIFRNELYSLMEKQPKTLVDTRPSSETPAAAIYSARTKTMLADGSDAADDADFENASGEVEFRRYLKPSTRSGWLGRLGHYEIETILGRGAFGIVAKALDEKLHRVVAIKLMNPDLAVTSPPRQRFLREARTAAAVSHENIVAIYAVEEQPTPYLVMEYVPGQTLQQRMDQKGPFETKDVLRIGQQVAAGLAAAHSAKLIHRDIKPSNILLASGPSERAKISDFGMARAVDDASMTQSGMIAGTPLYMAPEQARAEVLDHRADLFSLGSVMYQMASGRPPFRAANSLAVLKRVCDDTPRPLNDVIPEIPGWLEAIIFKLLEKKREDRFQTAQEVADLLARCQWELEHNGCVNNVKGSQSATDTQVSQASRATDQKAQWKPIGWLFGGVLAVSAVICFALMNGGKKSPELDRSTSSIAPSPPLPPSSSPPSSSPPFSSPTKAPMKEAPMKEAPTSKPPENIGSQGRPAESPNGDPPDSDARPLQEIAELSKKANGPKIAADGMTLWFHADRDAVNRRLVLWQSSRQSTNESFGVPVRVEDSINNQPDHNLTDVTLSADGLVLCFCRTKMGPAGNSDLWMSTRPSRDASWSEPISVGPAVNTTHGEWEPELSPNGLELFFHSSRPNGSGGTDLWVSRRANREAEFGPAENLGPNINSPDIEGGAAISGDGLTLMFNRFTTGNGNGSLWRATRNSLDAPFEAPEPVKISLPANEWFVSVCFTPSGEELYGMHRSKNGDTLVKSRLKPVGAEEALTKESPTTKIPGTIVSQGRPTKAPSGDPPESDASTPQVITELNGRGPKITADGMALWFHAADERDTVNRRSILWQSMRQSTNESFGVPVRVEDSINNQPDHNLTDVTLSADGLVMCFCRTKIGVGGNPDLWMSTRPSNNASWSEPISIGPGVNTEHGEWEPELSPNGLELFFNSSRPNQNGGTDLWVSRRANREAEFGPAENLGPNVNSKDNEGGAALSGDGLTLVFHRSMPTEMTLWRATRNSLAAAFEAPQRVKILLPGNDWFYGVCLTASGEELYGTHRSKDRITLAKSRLKPVGAATAQHEGAAK